jgi:hypothetical protein
MSLISPDELRLREPEIDPAWEDDALQGIIDTNEAEIVRLFGPHARMEERLYGGTAHLYPARQVGAIVSISETIGVGPGATTTVLDPTDFQLLDGGRTIRRLASGTNARYRWGLAEVEYVPLDDIQVRVGVLVDLCKVDLRPTGIESRTMGSWTEKYSSGKDAGREGERRAILRRLAPATVFA